MNEQICLHHKLGDKIYGRDDMTVQLKCLDCGEIISVNSADYDDEMRREAEEERK